jgi:TonB family protein
VRQGHTADVLWLKVWRALLWPNPFVHLLLPALRLTHEFLADQAATAGSAAPGPYASLLARLATQRPLGLGVLALAQPFAFSSTLTRIAMLKTPAPVRRWKQWLVLPVLGGLCLVACQSVPEPATIPPPPPPTLVPYEQQALTSGPKVYTYVEQMPQVPGGGGQRAIVQAIQERVVYPKGNSATGRVFVKFTVNSEGLVQDIAVVKGLNTACDQAVVTAIKQLPQFVPGKQRGKAVDVSFTVPVQFETQP